MKPRGQACVEATHASPLQVTPASGENSPSIAKALTVSRMEEMQFHRAARGRQDVGVHGTPMENFSEQSSLFQDLKALAVTGLEKMQAAEITDDFQAGAGGGLHRSIQSGGHRHLLIS
jgi:hypothetical protein